MLTELERVMGTLERTNISCSVGGSGLLLSLQLIDSVNDWDVTTEAPLDALLESLHEEKFQIQKSGDYPYQSDYRVRVLTEDKPIEIIGSFKLGGR